MTEKEKIYADALRIFGKEAQMIVAIEELSECQKELCKLLRGIGNVYCLAEEITDAQIMLEQMIALYDLDDRVTNYRAMKINRLRARVEETQK